LQYSATGQYSQLLQ